MIASLAHDAARIGEVTAARRVVLFGSAAERSTDTPNDIDLAVFVDDEHLAQAREALALCELTLPVAVSSLNGAYIKEDAAAFGFCYHVVLLGWNDPNHEFMNRNAHAFVDVFPVALLS